MGTCAKLGATFLFALALACVPFDEFPVEEDPLPGRVCYDDADCVPNDCCGEGTGAVHRLDGPDCSGVFCDGACDPDLIDCGCALPICRDGRCTAAYAEQCL